MLFNVEKTKEVIFSSKRSKPQHPPLNLGNDMIARKTEHKHLGMILDENLNFKSHIREAILKARRGIDMIKFLSKCVSRSVLDLIYKLILDLILITEILFIIDMIHICPWISRRDSNRLSTLQP